MESKEQQMLNLKTDKFKMLVAPIETSKDVLFGKFATTLTWEINEIE